MLKEYSLDWRLANRSPDTIYSYLGYLRKIEAEHGLPLDLLTAKMLVADKLASGVTPATVGFYVRALKSYHKWYADAFEVPDPLAKLGHPRVPQAAPGKIADDGDITKLLAASPGSDFLSVRDRTIVRLLRDSGMRRSELAKLKLADVDFDEGVMILRETKNGGTRVVPMSGDCRKALRVYIHRRSSHLWASDPHLMIGAKGPLRPNAIGLILRRMSERAGVSLSSHQFRRRLASTWVRSGGDDSSLMLLAGWKSPTMPARYRAEHRSEIMREQFHRLIG